MNVLIIEDELTAAQRLRKLILELDPSMVIIDVLDSVETSVEWLQQHPAPDLIMLDIHLADGSSFEIFSEITVTAPIIFTTAYDEYAIEAFKHNSIDYLLKPIKKPDLERSLQKFRRMQGSLPAAPVDYTNLIKALETSRTTFQKRIVIRYADRIKTIEITNAAYFYIESKVTFVRTKDGQSYPIDYNLDQLESILDPAQFYRINRKVIINLDAIANMYTYSKSRVKIELQPPAPLETIVSSERSGRFKRWLLGVDG